MLAIIPITINGMSDLLRMEFSGRLAFIVQILCRCRELAERKEINTIIDSAGFFRQFID
jgi:hypothetical protein